MRPKIIILIPCWKRAEIFRIMSNNLAVFIHLNTINYDFKVVYVFSKEDPELKALADIYNNACYDRDYCYFGNARLGKKHYEKAFSFIDGKIIHKYE